VPYLLRELCPSKHTQDTHVVVHRKERRLLQFEKNLRRNDDISKLQLLYAHLDLNAIFKGNAGFKYNCRPFKFYWMINQSLKLKNYSYFYDDCTLLVDLLFIYWLRNQNIRNTSFVPAASYVCFYYYSVWAFALYGLELNINLFIIKLFWQISIKI